MVLVGPSTHLQPLEIERVALWIPTGSKQPGPEGFLSSTILMDQGVTQLDGI
jgi:hypothetical protein